MGDFGGKWISGFVGKMGKIGDLRGEKGWVVA
jgi:hypothetical protein